MDMSPGPGPASGRGAEAAGAELAARALKVDYVSPLPPVRSGIADYSLDLLPHLDGRCDLRLIVLPALPVREDVIGRWSWAPLTAAGERGRLPLYQMGNNHFHEAVFRAAMERPGVMTLHDLVLHHFLLDRTLQRADLPAYREQLSSDHGWMGDVAALMVRWGVLNDATQFSLPVRRGLLRRQRGVLVHSRWAATQILEEDPEIRIRAVPMGVPLPAPPNPEEGALFRLRHDIPADVPLLGSLGFQTPIKRTAKAVAALASAELADAHLLVAGEVASILDLEGEARRAGVADRVHITGFLDFEEYHAAIAACDLCLNLRYPTAGETSAALLRVLAVGRPAAVSDYGQFAELPAEVAIKIPLGEGEVESLARSAGRLLGDRDRLAAMAGAAREYVRRHHDPATSAELVVEACREWRDLPPPGDAAPDIEPPTSLVWSELPGTLAVSGAETPWRVGERRRLRIRLENRGFARWLSTERGPGGVVVKVEFRGPRDNVVEGGAWVALLPDLDPGAGEAIETEIRRPAGASRIIVEPHVIGRAGFNALSGPVWERPI